MNLFRCRISNNEKLTPKNLGAPPSNLAKAGRLNPEWISVLYLSDNENACIQEVRGSFLDTIYIGKFILLSNVKLIDLSNFDVVTLNGDTEFLDYYLNRDVLLKIAEDFAKPTNNDFKLFNYLPLQYISEFIKSLDGKDAFDGIIYKSVIDKDALNLMLFDPKIAKCTKVYSKLVTEVTYSLEKI